MRGQSGRAHTASGRLRACRAPQRALLALAALATALASTGALRAQVIEPDGNSVPTRPAALNNLFRSRGEGLDAVTDASAKQTVFSPLCRFEGQLLLNGAQCRTDFGWYNVDANRAAPPAPNEVFTLVPRDAAIGQTFSGADIRSSNDWTGGLIGFAMRDDPNNSLCNEYHYSEAAYNRLCSGCTPPGPWITILTYVSTQTPNAYYMAVEDGTTGASSFMNDGDFDDKVFLITGITCPDGGQPCDSGEPGICGPGVNECTRDGVICKPFIIPGSKPEVCDGLDNDCNDRVDDGSLCSIGQTCFEGRCVAGCGGGEFPCPAGMECEQKSGFCMDPRCIDVKCQAGFVCREGSCVAACDGVVCPAGQVCQVGQCVDLCEGVQCESGQICERGACVDTCDCRVCPDGKACAADGACVDEGCQNISCDVGKVCVTGQCVDPCDGAKCPGGAECKAGKCGDPGDNPGSGTGGSSGPDIVIPTPGGGGDTAGPGTGAAGPGGGADGSGDNLGEGGSGDDGGCGCRVATVSAKELPLVTLAMLLVFGLGRRGRRTGRAGCSS